MPASYTLLVWSLFPEDLEFYLIPDAPNWLYECNGKLVNHVDTDHETTELLVRVSDALAKSKESCANPDDELATQWAQYKVDTPLVVVSQVTVISCGYIL